MCYTIDTKPTTKFSLRFVSETLSKCYTGDAHAAGVPRVEIKTFEKRLNDIIGNKKRRTGTALYCYLSAPEENIIIIIIIYPYIYKCIFNIFKLPQRLRVVIV